MTGPAKTIHALYAESSVAAVLHPDLRRDLAATGASRLQVNVDDADVADAQLRTVHGDRPIRAVVAVWSDAADLGAVVGAVRSLDPHAASWQVDERLPIRPPTVPDGRRTDALANVAFLRRPEELDRETWLDRWVGQHTRVAIDTQGTFGYVQNVVTHALTDQAPPVAGVVEELFPMAAMTDWHAFYGTGGSQSELERRMGLMAASCDRFGATRGINVVPTSRYVFTLG